MCPGCAWMAAAVRVSNVMMRVMVVFMSVVIFVIFVVGYLVGIRVF